MKRFNISFQELQSCWQYVYDERIGIMAEGEPPNEAQVAIAREEADAAMRRLKEELESQ